MPWPGWVGNAAGARRVWMCYSAGADYIGDWYRKQEKKPTQWGKREGKELCVQGLGFLIHAGTKRRAPPTAWLAGMPAMLRYRKRVHAGPGGSLQKQELRAVCSRIAHLLTLSCKASVVPRLSNLLKVRAKKRCGGKSSVSSLQMLHKPLASALFTGPYRITGMGLTKTWAVYSSNKAKYHHHPYFTDGVYFFSRDLERMKIPWALGLLFYPQNHTKGFKSK